MEQLLIDVRGTPSKTHLRMLSAFKTALKEKLGVGCLQIHIQWSSKGPCPAVIERESLSLSRVSCVPFPQESGDHKEIEEQAELQEFRIITGSGRQGVCEGPDATGRD